MGDHIVLTAGPRMAILERLCFRGMPHGGRGTLTGRSTKAQRATSRHTKGKQGSAPVARRRPLLARSSPTTSPRPSLGAACWERPTGG